LDFSFNLELSCEVNNSLLKTIGFIYQHLLNLPTKPNFFLYLTMPNSHLPSIPFTWTRPDTTILSNVLEYCNLYISFNISQCWLLLYRYTRIVYYTIYPDYSKYPKQNSYPFLIPFTDLLLLTTYIVCKSSEEEKNKKSLIVDSEYFKPAFTYSMFNKPMIM